MITLSPQTRFNKSNDVKNLRELVTKDWFLNACTFALAEMQTRIPRTSNVSDAWNGQCKMEGAKDFLGILLNFGEETAPQPKIPSKALKPDVSNPNLKKE